MQIGWTPNKLPLGKKSSLMEEIINMQLDAHPRLRFARFAHKYNEMAHLQHCNQKSVWTLGLTRGLIRDLGERQDRHLLHRITAQERCANFPHVAKKCQLEPHKGLTHPLADL